VCTPFASHLSASRFDTSQSGCYLLDISFSRHIADDSVCFLDVVSLLERACFCYLDIFAAVPSSFCGRIADDALACLVMSRANEHDNGSRVTSVTSSRLWFELSISVCRLGQVPDDTPRSFFTRPHF
jgi:hypothetical protein